MLYFINHCSLKPNLKVLEIGPNNQGILPSLKIFQNKITYANTYIKRIYGAAPGSGNTIKDNYYGDRYAILYSVNYNFNLDNSIVFGIEREDDKI